jgi:DNA-binding NtrC family response regulator
MKNKQTSILIVDNDASICKMLTTFLESRYSCTTASTAEKAISLLTFGTFDLVITDRELPGVSGLALCQFIKKTRPDTAVILISERITQWHKTVAEWLGVFDCIRRPCNFQSLPELVARALQSKAHNNGIEIRESVENVYQTA